MRIYENFAEAESSIRANAPPLLYKYRDWLDPYHKKILTEQQIWLSAPANLNDPYDIRIPLRFIPEEVDDPRFFQRLQETQQIITPHLDPESREFQTFCENQLDLIKVNPIKWFNDRWEQIRVSNIYDCFGVFSLTHRPLEPDMWDKYGGVKDLGFCVGWESVELARALDDVGLGKVWYQDEPMVHSFLTQAVDQEVLKQYVKHTKWSYEQGWRFVTPQIEREVQRARTFEPASVREVILNDKMPASQRREVITVLRELYGSQPTLYVLHRPPSGLDRILIDY